MVTTEQPRIVSRVLVAYESSPRGRAALFHAMNLARDIDARVTVVAVARRERLRIGCATCQATTAFWNHEMQALAEQDLAEAGDLVGPAPTIEYAVACGSSPREALVQAAMNRNTVMIVVPREPTGRVRRLFSSRLARQLRSDGRWAIVTSPT
jgi:nucleotide-binding universal stress UspA family protein